MNSIFGHLTECWKGDGSAETPFLDYASTAEIWMEWWLSDHVQETSGAGQLSLYEL